MRLFLLGATGRIGQELTSQALERGHGVTAFVRSPDKLTVRNDRLHIVTGDPRNAEQLARALAGHDAVLSALGPTSRDPTTLLGDAAQSTLAAMQQTGVRRLLVVSTALLFPDTGVPGRIFGFIFRNGRRDSQEMERLLDASGVDWTVVRPPRLTNGAGTTKYRLSEHAPPANSIARADVARCLLDLVEARGHVKKVVGVSK